MNGDALTKLCDLILLAAGAGTVKKVVCSKPVEKTTVRTTLTLRVIGGKSVLQAERLCTDHKALHENIPADDRERICTLLSGYGQINLLTAAGECELRSSKSGTRTLIGGEKLEKQLALATVPAEKTQTNNNEKDRILRGDEPFLRLLDVSDENGRVRDKKQSKFRQINRFLELIRDCEDKLPAEGTLRICDLCCGKSYLSFAAYHYFVNVLGRRVKMTGVDLKSDVIVYCNGVAQKLGFDGLEFLCGDVGKYDAGEHVHLVISLHACDLATDLVLCKAAEWQAEVVLSTPCCHHELNHLLNCPTLDFIAEHSMLRQKLCDAATDALRLKRLEAEGYAVTALELIDPEETPKNIMLRALRRKDPDPVRMQKAREEYLAIRRFLVGDTEEGHF